MLMIFARGLKVCKKQKPKYQMESYNQAKACTRCSQEDQNAIRKEALLLSGSRKNGFALSIAAGKRSPQEVAFRKLKKNLIFIANRKKPR
jgi:hypothetical protein